MRISRDRVQPFRFPETPEGQRELLDEVNRLVLSAPNDRGIGVFWWEPAITGRLCDHAASNAWAGKMEYALGALARSQATKSFDAGAHLH